MESSPRSVSAGLRALVAVAALFIVIAGMRAAASLIVPFLLALSISIICLPPLAWMRSKGVPSAVAIALLAVGIIAGLSVIGVIIGSSASDFIHHLPRYQNRVQAMFKQIELLSGHFGVQLSTPALRKVLKPSAIFSMIGNFVSSFGSVLSDSFLIVVTVLFILFEASVLPEKFLALPESSPRHRSVEFFSTFVTSVQRYVVLKTATSLLTGVCVGLALWLIGLRYALLWGLLAFLLNFVPYVGAIIASVPAILLAYLQGGWALFGESIGIYTVVYTIIGNFVEPKWYGQNLGLSTLVVFVSLILWAWVLGPVGMLLSIPLTIIIKMALESNPNTRWIAVLIGATPHASGVQTRRFWTRWSKR